MTDRSRAGRIARDRGKRWEREVANYMKQWFPNAHRRGYDQAGNAVRAAGEQTPDVAGTPYWIECKSRSANVTALDVKRWLYEASGFKDVLLFVYSSTQGSMVYLMNYNTDNGNEVDMMSPFEFAMLMDFEQYLEEDTK